MYFNKNLLFLLLVLFTIASYILIDKFLINKLLKL